MVTKISLTQGLFALVDDEDAEIVNQYKWYTQRCKNLLYAVKAVPTGNGKQAKLFMHTFLTGFKITDHIDGDGLRAQVAENNFQLWIEVVNPDDEGAVIIEDGKVQE